MSPSPACLCLCLCLCPVPVPCSDGDIHWQQRRCLYANEDCGWTSVSFCACALIACLCVFSGNSFHSCCFFSPPALSTHSPHPSCFFFSRKVQILWSELCCFLCREWWHLPEAGAVHLQHRLGDLSSRSGMHGSLPPQQVSDASQHHISRVCPRLFRRSTLLLWHEAQWNSENESAKEDV